MFDLCIEPFKTSCFNEEPARGRYETAISVLEFVCRGGYQGELEELDLRDKRMKFRDV